MNDIITSNIYHNSIIKSVYRALQNTRSRCFSRPASMLHALAHFQPTLSRSIITFIASNLFPFVRRTQEPLCGFPVTWDLSALLFAAL